MTQKAKKKRVPRKKTKTQVVETLKKDKTVIAARNRLMRILSSTAVRRTKAKQRTKKRL